MFGKTGESISDLKFQISDDRLQLILRFGDCHLEFYGNMPNL